MPTQTDIDEAVAVVARALRNEHTLIKEKARVIVTVSPEEAARTAVGTLANLGWGPRGHAR